MASLPVPLGREPLHRPGVLGVRDGEGTAHQHQGSHAGAAWCRRLFRAEGAEACLGLAQPRGEQDGFWIDAGEQSLLLVPVDCVVIAPQTFPCLPEPWALHGEPGTPLHLLPCRGDVVGNTARMGNQQSPLPGCQPLTEGSDPGGRVEGHRCCTPQRLLSGIRLPPSPEDVCPAVLQISMNSMISRCALHLCSLQAWMHVMAQPGSSLGPASPAPQSHPESPKPYLR